MVTSFLDRFLCCKYIITHSVSNFRDVLECHLSLTLFPCTAQVIERHFWLKHKEILEQVEGWITNMESLSENRRAGKTIAHSTVGLKVLYHKALVSHL